MELKQWLTTLAAELETSDVPLDEAAVHTLLHLARDSAHEVERVAREEGEAAAVELACAPPSLGPRRAIERAFHGRPIHHTEGTWRANLKRGTFRAAAL